MSRYVINILASRDLNEIAEYFANYNVAAGDFSKSLIAGANNW